MSEVGIINREATDSIKGIRFQKIRLLRKMLQIINEHNDCFIIGFPEFWEDLYIIGEANTEVMEQDKEYKSKFTINSKEIRKAFVSFLDIYIHYQRSSTLRFVFHTNTEYGHENKTEMLKSLELEPQEKPIFDYLIQNKLTSKVVNFMSKIIVYSYKEIYGERKSNIEVVESMTEQQWKDFLNKVSYEFGQPSLEEINSLVLKDIEQCKFFSPDLVGKEESLKSILLETIDERMSEKIPLKKAITSKEIELIYFKAKYSPQDSKFDPMYEEWESIVLEKDELNDIRNIKEKIYSVCPEFSQMTLKVLSREATTAKAELNKLSTKQINAIKTRVYESMGDFLVNNYIFKESLTQKELKELIVNLKSHAIEDFKDLKKDYDYGLENSRIIEKVVVMLIDECFYCFEGEMYE